MLNKLPRLLVRIFFYTRNKYTSPPGIVHFERRIWTKSFQIVWNRDGCLYTSFTWDLQNKRYSGPISKDRTKINQI